jgi:hypothetical protein
MWEMTTQAWLTITQKVRWRNMALRACHMCRDEYYGNSWGIELLDENKKEIVICFYCYYGQKERQYKPEWETSC